MTHRERDLLRFIERYTIEHDGVAPTLAEMAKAMGVKSKSTAYSTLQRLRRQGRVSSEPAYSRAVTVAAPLTDLASVPDGVLLEEAAARGLLAGGST